MAHTPTFPRFGRLSDSAYEKLLKLMFRIPPERIHGMLSGAFRRTADSQVACAAVRRALVVDDPVLSQTVAGIRFDRPLGLAAGFDKNAEERSEERRVGKAGIAAMGRG